MQSSDPPPAPRHCLEIASMIVFGAAVATGIGSAICLGLDDEDWYDSVDDDEVWSPHDIAAISLGTLCTILSAIAIPLMSCAAGAYMKQRHSKGKRWAMITSWVLYGVVLINAVTAIVLGASEDADPGPGFVVWGVAVTTLAWSFMFVRATHLRKTGVFAETTAYAQPVIQQQKPEDQVYPHVVVPVVAPRASNFAPPPPTAPADNDDDESWDEDEDESVTNTVRDTKTKPDGTQVDTELKTTTHRNKMNSSVKTIRLSKVMDNGSMKEKVTVVTTNVNGEQTKTSKTCDIPVSQV